MWLVVYEPRVRPRYTGMYPCHEKVVEKVRQGSRGSSLATWDTAWLEQ